MMVRLQDVLYETQSRAFWVLNVGDKGFEVYRAGTTASTKVAAIGQSLGLQRAIDEANKREDMLYAGVVAASC